MNDEKSSENQGCISRNTSLVILIALLVMAVIALALRYSHPHPRTFKGVDLDQSFECSNGHKQSIRKTIDRIVAEQSKAIFAIAPDGKSYAYRLVKQYTYELWVADMATDTKKLLLSSEQVLTMARFSPSGRYLHVLKDINAAREYQLLVFDLAQNGTLVGSSADFTKVAGAWWQGNLERVFFLPNVEGKKAIAYLDLLNGQQVTLPSAPEEVSKLAIRSDDECLAIISTKDSIYEYCHSPGTYKQIETPEGFTAKKINKLRGSKNYLIDSIRHENKSNKEFLLTPSGQMKSLDLDVPVNLNIDLIFPATEKQIAVRTEHSASHELYIYDEGEFRKLEGLQSGVLWPVNWSDDNKTLFFTWQNFQNPSNFYKATVKDKQWIAEKIELSTEASDAVGGVFKELRSLDVPLEDGQRLTVVLRSPEKNNIKGAFLYLPGTNDSDSLKNVWSPQFEVLGVLGWAVASVVFPDAEKSGAMKSATAIRSNLLRVRDFIAKTYGLQNRQLALYGSSEGASMGSLSVVQYGDEWQGFLDIGGDILAYNNPSSHGINTRWILAFHGEKDPLASKRDRSIRKLAEVHSPEIPISIESLPHDGHVLFFPENWRSIYESIAQVLIRDDLIANKCD